MDEEPKIKALIVLDVIGKPPEHLFESLKHIIAAIDNEKGVNVLKKNIKEPRLMEGQKEFYTTFAEVELEVESISNLLIVMFKYMPAHLEVIYPEIIAISNNSWNDILNELARRMHSYDEVARMLQNENQLLRRKVEELTGVKTVTPMSPIGNLPQKKKSRKAEAKGKKKKTKKKVKEK